MTFDLAALDAALTKCIEKQKLPGVTASIRGPEGVIFEKGYGWQDAAKTRPMDENTVMGIASMSKSMTSLSLAILASEGKCSFDDPVEKYFPDFRVAGTPRQTVTLRHLAMHTAGIPPMEPLEWSIVMNSVSRHDSETEALRATSPNKMDTIEQIIDYIGSCGYETLGAPGEYMSYSNEGYAILSYIVDIAAGQSLEEFLKERVFAPIGMTRTVLDIDGSEARAMAGGNMTSLWSRDDDDNFTADDDWSILPPFRGCACVKSTAHDMARYYQCISNRGVIDGVEAIPAAAVELLVGAGFPLTEKAFYCYGLNKRLWHGHTICEHDGGLHGVSTHGGLFLDENYGFALLTNEGGQDTDELGWMLYNAVIGRPLDEEQVWLHPRTQPFPDPEMLAGDFLCHEGVPAIASVSVRDGQLFVHRNDQDQRLVWCGETWFLAFDPDGKRVGRMHFFVRNGKAWAAQVYTRIYQRV